MDYRYILKNSLSRSTIDSIALDVYDDISNFEILFDLIFDTDEKVVAWRAAWACEKIIQKFPEFLTKNKKSEIINTVLTTNHEGIRRLSLSILLSIPELKPIDVRLLNACFDWINSDSQPIAVQALSLKILLKFCNVEPDLIPELRAYLENTNSDTLSPGMISSRRNALKILNKKSLYKSV